MRAWLLETDANVVRPILRFTLAVVIFPHGVQKVLGWFGGQGFTPTLQFFTSAGIPPALALLAMATCGIACVMLVAMATVHWSQGFFMNWSGAQQGEGFEYHLLALGIAIALIIVGGGTWSVDRTLTGAP
jgi:putative oxidoreductase